MKKMVILAVISMMFILNAAMEEYDRKSISIFKMDVAKRQGWLLSRISIWFIRWSSTNS